MPLPQPCRLYHRPSLKVGIRLLQLRLSQPPPPWMCQKRVRCCPRACCRVRRRPARTSSHFSLSRGAIFRGGWRAAAERQEWQEVGAQICCRQQIRRCHRQAALAPARGRQSGALSAPAASTAVARVLILLCSSVSSRAATRSSAPRPMPCSVTSTGCAPCCAALDVCLVCRPAARPATPRVAMCVFVYACFCCILCGAACSSHRVLLQTARRPAVMVVSYCNKINYG